MYIYDRINECQIILIVLFPKPEPLFWSLLRSFFTFSSTELTRFLNSGLLILDLFLHSSSAESHLVLLNHCCLD
jgi:hypothetical protein